MFVDREEIGTTEEKEIETDEMIEMNAIEEMKEGQRREIAQLFRVIQRTQIRMEVKSREHTMRQITQQQLGLKSILLQVCGAWELVIP